MDFSTTDAANASLLSSSIFMLSDPHPEIRNRTQSDELLSHGSTQFFTQIVCLDNTSE